MRLALTFAFALLVACGRETKIAPVPVASASASSPACTQTYAISTAVSGSWFGDATNEAGVTPSLVVRFADASLGPPDSLTLARIPIALPFFDADVKLSELCADEPAAPGSLAVKCVSAHGKISRVVVRASGDVLESSVDAAPFTRWQMTYAPERFTGACYTLHGLGAARDLEPARAAWGRDTPSARCGNVPHSHPVHVAFDFAAPADATPCSERGSPLSSMKVSISTGTLRKDLGVLSSLCGGLHPTRYTDADAISLGTSDMGVESRFAYRLADKLYVVEGGDHVTSTDLACGSKVSFDVHYRWHDVPDEHAALR